MIQIVREFISIFYRFIIIKIYKKYLHNFDLTLIYLIPLKCVGRQNGNGYYITVMYGKQRKHYFHIKFDAAFDSNKMLQFRNWYVRDGTKSDSQ